jgi:hypothetical protein
MNFPLTIHDWYRTVGQDITSLGKWYVAISICTSGFVMNERVEVLNNEEEMGRLNLNFFSKSV